MTDLLEMFSINVDEVRGCPDCGMYAMHVSAANGEILWKCEQCECEAVDGRSDLVDDALLSPREIRGIRKQYSLSRKKFAELTRFAEGSIKRWETGKVVQNASANRFLILIRLDPRIIKWLQVIKVRSTE